MAGELTHEGRIGPYRQLALLGEGGMGVVYRGADPAGRDVAIKVLKPEIARDPTALRRLAREVDLMRRVLSPHVADVLDGEVTADHPFVVTRFVPGRPLDDVVAEQGPLTGAALRRLALGLAKALTAIHDAGVVHRDLKPSNVLLVGGEPVVIDFGIAQAFDSTRLTQTGMVAGTPGYLAPEVLAEERATAAADVHAWAATVAFAATGRPPFGRGNREVVFYNIINGRADLTGVPEPLQPLLRRALARDPAHRPRAAELTAAAAALDLGPDDRPAGPIPQPRASAPTVVVPEPRAERPATRVAPVPRLALGTGWSRLFAALAVVIVVSAAIMMPVAGALLAVAGVLTLRTLDSHRPARALARTALTLPYAAIFTVAATLGLIALVIIGARTEPLGACAWGVGAGAAALWTGPGVHAPRRQLERLFSTLTTEEPRRIALVGTALGLLAFVAVVGAVSLTPSFAPMYGLQTSLVNSLDRLQDALH